MSAPDNRWGPQWLANGALRFRLWAPSQHRVMLDLDGIRLPMTRTGDWFEIDIDTAQPGKPYTFVLDDGRRVADPASRGQASDLAGPSLVPAAHTFPWRHGDWKGRLWTESVIYELHVGTFTPEGTFAAATAKLAGLASIGFTAIELMPVAHFPGDRGWGYDGVLQYAPHSAYGTPDDLKALVDAAHGHGLMVFLDVVYNHFGGEHNYLSLYAPDFFRADKATPWGQAIAFARPPVRQYFLDNVHYWLRDFHLDGLRLDAVDQIEDDSDIHILEEIAVSVRKAFAGRHVHLIVENPASTPDLLVRKNDQATLYDADWNDDFHHSVHVAATGEGSGNYSAFADRPWHNVARALTTGPIFPGKPLLTSVTLHPQTWHASAYVNYLQNHDQVGNRAFGERLWQMIDKKQWELWTALLLLSPQIPLMFMGDEFLADSRFHFFADYEGDIAEAVRLGRPVEAKNFGGIPDGRREQDMLDPLAPSTFETCKLEWRQALGDKGQAWKAFVAGLLSLRRTHLLPYLARPSQAQIVGSDEALLCIDWTMDGKLFEIRVNFSDQPRRDITIVGTTLYRDGTFDGHTLGSCSLVFAGSNP
jgi:malto-oligosyltrehalose trehalohydrolase